MSGRCHLRVEARPDGQRVRFERCRVTIEGTNDARLDAWRSLLERLTAIDQSYLVNAKGEMVGLEGIADVQHALNQWLQEDGNSEGLNAESLSLIRDTLYSEERLTAEATEEWNAIVGIWAGGDLNLGETYSARIDQPVPVLPDKKLPMDITIAASRRAPCRSDETAARCVEMTFNSAPDPTAASEITKMLAAQLAGATQEQGSNSEPRLQLERVEIRHRIMLLTEPDRLIPHRLERIKDTRFWIRSAHKQAEPIVQVEEFVHEFAYDRGR